MKGYTLQVRNPANDPAKAVVSGEERLTSGRSATVGSAKRSKSGSDDDDGYIVVETIGAFVPFVLLIVSILSLVNIVAVQARVHYAMTQAANTLSMYSYTLEVLGIAKDLTALDNKAYKVTDEVHGMIDDINGALNGLESMSGVWGAIESGGNAIDRAVGWGEKVVSDPKDVLKNLMSYTLDELRNKALEELSRPLIGRYLANGSMSGDAYLRNAGVVNTSGSETLIGINALDFYQIDNFGRGNSVLIDRDGNVKLTVEYEILYTFGSLPLPFKPTLHITQTVITKAWLNGSGKGYW